MRLVRCLHSMRMSSISRLIAFEHSNKLKAVVSLMYLRHCNVLIKNIYNSYSEDCVVILFFYIWFDFCSISYDALKIDLLYLKNFLQYIFFILFLLLLFASLF